MVFMIIQLYQLGKCLCDNVILVITICYELLRNDEMKMTECAAYGTHHDPPSSVGAAEYDSINDTQLSDTMLSPHDDHTS